MRLRLVARARGTSPWVNTLRDAPLLPSPPLPPPSPILPSRGTTTTTNGTGICMIDAPRHPPSPRRREDRRLFCVFWLPGFVVLPLNFFLCVSNHIFIYQSLSFSLPLSCSIYLLHFYPSTVSPIRVMMTHIHRHGDAFSSASWHSVKYTGALVRRFSRKRTRTLGYC